MNEHVYLTTYNKYTKWFCNVLNTIPSNLTSIINYKYKGSGYYRAIVKDNSINVEYLTVNQYIYYLIQESGAVNKDLHELLDYIYYFISSGEEIEIYQDKITEKTRLITKFINLSKKYNIDYNFNSPMINIKPNYSSYNNIFISDEESLFKIK